MFLNVMLRFLLILIGAIHQFGELAWVCLDTRDGPYWFLQLELSGFPERDSSQAWSWVIETSGKLLPYPQYGFPFIAMRNDCRSSGWKWHRAVVRTVLV